MMYHIYNNINEIFCQIEIDCVKIKRIFLKDKKEEEYL